MSMPASFSPRIRWFTQTCSGVEPPSEATLPITSANLCGLRRRRCVMVMLALACILSSTTLAERLPLRLYTTEDGLWSGVLNYIMRDSHGFMWFCTRDGLSRFDGYRFTNYRIGGGPSSHNFTYMFESRDGIFWIVLGDKRLYRIDPRFVTKPTQRTQGYQANDDDGRVPLHAELVSL